jgi:hypothetical protein
MGSPPAYTPRHPFTLSSALSPVFAHHHISALCCSSPSIGLLCSFVLGCPSDWLWSRHDFCHSEPSPSLMMMPTTTVARRLAAELATSGSPPRAHRHLWRPLRRPASTSSSNSSPPHQPPPRRAPQHLAPTAMDGMYTELREMSCTQCWERRDRGWLCNGPGWFFVPNSKSFRELCSECESGQEFGLWEWMEITNSIPWVAKWTTFGIQFNLVQIWGSKQILSIFCSIFYHKHCYGILEVMIQSNSLVWCRS